MEPKGDERRRFRRVQAPVYFTSARMRTTHTSVIDVGVGGVRVYSDEAFRIGDPIDIELFLPDGESVACHARIAWQARLPKGAPAKYDVGLEITSAPEEGLQRLVEVLESDAASELDEG